MTGYIPKEQIRAFTRWEADDFSPIAPPKPEIPPVAPPPSPPLSDNSAPQPAPPPRLDIPLPTAEELERIHEEAHSGGYQAGLEEGRKAGYDAGHAEGLEAGNAAAQTHVEQCRDLARSLQEAFEQLDQQMAESVLNCALAVAQRVILGAARIRPETLLPIIREALAALPIQHSPVTLLVSPENLPLAKEHLGDTFAASGWKIQEDPEITPGGCRLKAGNSEVDATLPTRWRRALEAIGLVNAEVFALEPSAQHVEAETPPNRMTIS